MYPPVQMGVNVAKSICDAEISTRSLPCGRNATPDSILAECDSNHFSVRAISLSRMLAMSATMTAFALGGIRLTSYFIASFNGLLIAATQKRP